MVKKGDLLKIFFVYLCLWQCATPTHPCGTNPLSRLRQIAQSYGSTTQAMLTAMAETYPTKYSEFQRRWRTYADCVGLVDTGYFKRSGQPLDITSDTASQDFSKTDSADFPEFRPRREELLLLLRRLTEVVKGQREESDTLDKAQRLSRLM